RAVERVEILAEPRTRHQAHAAADDLLDQRVVAVLAEAGRKQPVRVEPDRAAPVPSRVETLAEEVVARDNEAELRLWMEARGVQVRDDRLDLFPRELRVEEWRERHDGVLRAAFAADHVQSAELPL